MATKGIKNAVLSGKGGTGKTFVSVNLACAQADSTYVDCDVEEPNGNNFLHAPQKQTTEVTAMLPAYDADKCVGCRACVDFCKFNALSYTANKVHIFGDICHGCGGCERCRRQHGRRHPQPQVGRHDRHRR